MILEHLLSAETAVPSMDSLDAWWSRHEATAQRFEHPIDAAMACGFDADRVAYAFGSGYIAAGHAMFPQYVGRKGALCATEEGGAHPRAIQTTLKDGRLNGSKRFVTFGTCAEVLFVVCSEGERDGRNQLRVVAISPREGVNIEPITMVPFVPEIPHGVVRFDNVAVADDEMLEGDGYVRYLKPFRTVEDCHVHAALLSWLIRIARAVWEREVVEQLLVLVTAIRALALDDPSSLAVHVALGGALEQSTALIETLDWSRVDELTRTRWERDRPLLRVAGNARGKRLEAAWRRLTDVS
jgi:acyl-CoA dehydrogenase